MTDVYGINTHKKCKVLTNRIMLTVTKWLCRLYPPQHD